MNRNRVHSDVRRRRRRRRKKDAGGKAFRVAAAAAASSKAAGIENNSVKEILKMKRRKYEMKTAKKWRKKSSAYQR